MSKAEKISSYKYYYALMDFLVLCISFVFTSYAMMTIKDINADRIFTPVFPLVIVLFMLSILLIFEFNRLYSVDIIRSRTKQLSAVIKSLLAGSFYIFIVTILIMSIDLTEAGLLLLAFSAVAFSLLYVLRIEVLRNVILNERADDKKVLIIGDGESGRKIAEALYTGKRTGYSLIDRMDWDGNQLKLNREELTQVVSSGNVDEVIISFDNIEYNEIFQIHDMCNELKIPATITSDLFKVIPDHFKTSLFFGVNVVDLAPRNTSKEVKRVVDVLLSISGLISLFPLFILVGILIKATSKGPILYKHKRVGLNGETFEFYKFRSMTISDEDDAARKELMLKFMKQGYQQGDSTKIINNNRVTKVGAFIRKYSIDELPQLLNVLKGDMSLVGPRPSLPYEFENYEPWQRKRVSVLPGCTGVWQVTGRSLVSFNESVLLDLYYLNRMSTFFDLFLILKTIPVMIFSKGGK